LRLKIQKKRRIQCKIHFRSKKKILSTAKQKRRPRKEWNEPFHPTDTDIPASVRTMDPKYQSRWNSKAHTNGRKVYRALLYTRVVKQSRKLSAINQTRRRQLHCKPEFGRNVGTGVVAVWITQTSARRWQQKVYNHHEYYAGKVCLLLKDLPSTRFARPNRQKRKEEEGFSEAQNRQNITRLKLHA
jgi:hypothetical protein